MKFWTCRKCGLANVERNQKYCGGCGSKRKGEVTLRDLEVRRYENIRLHNPKVKTCSVKSCSNPRDSTPILGESTCCAYHRLLFDFWSSEAMDDDKLMYYLKNQRARRTAFTKWRNERGKTMLDSIVLRMVNEGINWEC